MYNRPVGSLVLLQIRTVGRYENPLGAGCNVVGLLVDIGLTDLPKTTLSFTPGPPSAPGPPGPTGPSGTSGSDRPANSACLFCITPLAPTVMPTVVIFYEQDKRNGDVR